MNDPERCPQCNGLLVRTTGEPVCPACLIRNSLEHGDSSYDPEQTTDPGSAENHWDSMRSVGGDQQSIVLQPQTVFGDYRIIGRLGRGGMGVVYEAEHLPTSRRMALKVLAQSLDQPEAKARFLREGRLAASINHPNSVYVYGTDEIEGIPTIAMELVDGGTLAERVKANGPMAIRHAVDAVIQIIDGLEAAEQRGVLHRDVKPSNCFVTAQGTVKVGDFGLSISTTGNHLHSVTNITTEGSFLGTPAFASPEQLRGEPLDRRSDIYAVGVTLFYLLTGRVPFDAENMVHLLATVLDQEAPTPSSLRGDIPSELDRSVVKCLQKSAGNRYESYAALRKDLMPFSSQSPLPASLGDRTLAGIVDAAVCWAALFPLSFLTYYQSKLFTSNWVYGTRSLMMELVGLALTIGYYAVAEWRYGRTIGKRLLGLRVAAGESRPRFWQALSRALLYLGLPVVPSLILNWAYRDKNIADFYYGTHALIMILTGLSFYVLKFGLFVTARAGNGYAAIHDRISGTRVLELADVPERNNSGVSTDFEIDLTAEKLGPYHQLQTLRENNNEKLVLGYDARLLRRVWLHVQPIGTPAVESSGGNEIRIGALRWLGGRRSESECWDCYEAPEGQSIVDLAVHSDGNECVRALQRLVQFLTSTDANHVPRSPEDVWVTNHEEIKILPINEHSEPEASANKAKLVNDTARQLWESANEVSRFTSWSLSQRQLLQSVQAEPDFSTIVSRVSQPLHTRSARFSSRVWGLLAVTMAFPLMTLIVGVLGLLLVEDQKRRYPEIERLKEAAKVLIAQQNSHPSLTKMRTERSAASSEQGASWTSKQEKALLDQFKAAQVEKEDRIRAIHQYVAGNFRDVLEDKDRMSSFYAMTTLPPAYSQTLQRALEIEPPNANELAIAEKRFHKIHREFQSADTPNMVNIEFSFWRAEGPVYSWLEFIWFPSLISGLLFRGGLLVRMFGLVYVNRHGQRASGLRVFIRMIVSGLPAIAIVFLSLSTMTAQVLGKYTWITTHGQWLTGVAVAVLAALMFSYYWRYGNQGFSDRLAGTYLMVS